MTNNRVGNILTGILVACAVSVVALLIRRELFAADADEAVVYPQPRQIPNWKDLAKGGHMIGLADAPIKVVEFSDFQCPFCKDLDLTLRLVLARNSKQIAVVYRHFPLSPRIHPFAQTAAIASECAFAQGRFKEYHDLLFSHQDSIGVTSWENFAEMAGVPDTARFRACRQKPWAAGRVAEDVAAAKRLSIAGTPTLIIGDRLVTAALPLDTLEAWIGRYAHTDSAVRAATSR